MQLSYITKTLKMGWGKRMSAADDNQSNKRKNRRKERKDTIITPN